MGYVGLMVVVVGMGSLWWRWLWFLVEFGVHRSYLGGLGQILTLFSKVLRLSHSPTNSTPRSPHGLVYGFLNFFVKFLNFFSVSGFLSTFILHLKAYQGFWVSGSSTMEKIRIPCAHKSFSFSFSFSYLSVSVSVSQLKWQCVLVRHQVVVLLG